MEVTGAFNLKLDDILFPFARIHSAECKQVFARMAGFLMVQCSMAV